MQTEYQDDTMITRLGDHIGHDVRIITYRYARQPSTTVAVALECDDCAEVVMNYDICVNPTGCQL